jgi:hypothetical protein
MTTRIAEPALEDTNKLLLQVLQQVLQDERVCFTCPAGESDAIVQRLRMQLSRHRQRMRARGKVIQEFTLHSSTHPETHSGIRYDCVVMWRVKSKVQQAELEMEKLLRMTGTDS